MVQLVVWDWNGTLFADTQALMDAGNHVIKTYGGTPLPRAEYVKNFDFPTIDFYCQQGCDREALERPESAVVFHEFYESRASRCRTRRGAREVLSWLQEQSINSVILSNHTQSGIVTQLARLGLTDHIHEVLANTDLGSTTTGMNKIQRIIGYLAREEYEPLDGLIVGDSPEDVNIGKELDLTTVAIKDGYFSTSRLRASNPDHLIGSLSKLIEIINTH